MLCFKERHRPNVRNGLFRRHGVHFEFYFSPSYYGMLRRQSLYSNYIWLISHWPESALKSSLSMFTFLQRSTFKDFNVKLTEMVLEKFNTKCLVWDVLPDELVEFPVMKNNTPSRDEVRKVRWTLNSAFKLKLSTSKREIVLVIHYRDLGPLKNGVYI